MDTDNKQYGRWGVEQGLGGGGQMWRKWETSEIVSTIKKRKKICFKQYMVKVTQNSWFYKNGFLKDF